MEEGLESALSRREQKNRARKIDGEVEAKVIALACKTKTSRRSVSVDDGVLEVLAAWREHVKKDKKLSAMIEKNGIADYVMVNAEDNPIKYQTLYNNMKLYIKRHGYLNTATSHWLLHTFATALDEAGEDVSVIQEQLGHKDSSTTIKSGSFRLCQFVLWKIYKQDAANVVEFA